MTNRPADVPPAPPLLPRLALGLGLLALVLLGVTTLIFAGGVFDSGGLKPGLGRTPTLTPLPGTPVHPPRPSPAPASRTPGIRVPLPTRAPGTAEPRPTAPGGWESGQIGDSSVVKIGPTPTLEPGAVAPTEPAPSDTPGAASALTVTQFVVYPNPLGGTRVVGLVQNDGKTALGEIRVTARLAVGSRETGSDTLLAGLVLPPGDRAPFQLTLPDEVSAPSQVRISSRATAAPPGAASVQPLDSLTATGVQLVERATLGGQSLTGQVANSSAAPVTAGRILAAGYDAAGQLVDVGKQTGPLGSVPPGGVLPFRINFARLDVPIVTYDVWVFGQQATP